MQIGQKPQWDSVQLKLTAFPSWSRKSGSTQKQCSLCGIISAAIWIGLTKHSCMSKHRNRSRLLCNHPPCCWFFVSSLQSTHLCVHICETSLGFTVYLPRLYMHDALGLLVCNQSIQDQHYVICCNVLPVFPFIWLYTTCQRTSLLLVW